GLPAQAPPDAERVHVVGLSPARISQEPRAAHRPHLHDPGARRPAGDGGDGSQPAQGEAAVGPRAGDRRDSRTEGAGMSVKDADADALDLMETFIRKRHARMGERHAHYRRVADALEAAQARERAARQEWDLAREAVAAAKRAMEEFWVEWEAAMPSMDAASRAEL